MMEATTKQSKSSGLAVTALVLGIVAFCLAWTGVFGLILAILALVFGIVALVKKQSKGMGITGVVLGAVALIIALVMTLIGAALLGGAAKVAHDVNQAQQAVDSAKKDFAKGEMAMFGPLHVEATKVTPGWKDQYLTPESGNQYVYVSLSIKNTGNDSVSVNPYDFNVDADGVVTTSYEIGVSAKKQLNAVDLKPGATITGDVVYQVKKSAKHLKLVYKTYDTKALKDVTYTLALK